MTGWFIGAPTGGRPPIWRDHFALVPSPQSTELLPCAPPQIELHVSVLLERLNFIDCLAIGM
jgi:hypothetical protein